MVGLINLGWYMVHINPKATDWGPLGPRTRLPWHIFSGDESLKSCFSKFVTKMVFYKRLKTESEYLIRFFSYYKKYVGVPGDPGARILVFLIWKKIQKYFRIVLTIDFQLFFNID